MRVTAAQLARATHVLLIGVGEYALPGPDRLTAAEDVKRLRAALIDPSACCIPEGQVRTLVDGEASKEHVLDAVRQLGMAAEESSTAVIYFSGHGHRIGERFFFQLFDSDPDSLAGTALSAEELTSCLEGCRARGVLVIADCCVGAGFAETAPRFFFELGSRDFRIAIAASRATQPSWEAPGQGGSLFTSHLVRILTGQTPTGSQPGEITYLGLVEALSFAINEDLTLVRPDHPRQELVANGSTVEDPLLFVCARAAMDGLTVQTGRVSREHMRRVMRRAAIGAIVGLLTATGLYCTWMAAHEYAIAGKVTTVWRGHPSLGGFGYPVEELRLDYGVDDYAPNSVLGRKKPLVALSGHGHVLDAIEESLSVPLRAKRLAEVGHGDAAYSLLVGAAQAGTLTQAQGVEAMRLRYRLAPLQWLPRLKQTARRSMSPYRYAALRALMDLSPADGLQELIDDLDRPSRSFDHSYVLNFLVPPCSAEELRYLRALVKRSWIDGQQVLRAWWHLGCPVQSEDVRPLVEEIEEVDLVGRWARLAGFRQPEEILEATDLSPDRRAGFALGYGTPCPVAQLGPIQNETALTRVQFLRHAIRACKGSRLDARAVPNGLEITLLLDGTRVPEATVLLRAPVLSSNSPDWEIVRPALLLLQEGQVKGADSYLIEQALHGENRVALAAVHTARRLNVPWQPGQGLFRGGEYHDYGIEYYLWMRSSAPQEADRIMLAGIGDEDRGFSSDEYFGRAELTDEALRSLRSILAQSVDRRSEAAARLVAMYGGDEDLTLLLESPEPGIRSALSTHGVFNPRFRSWLARQETPWPVFDRNALEPTLTYMEKLDRKRRSLGPADACWLLDLEGPYSKMVDRLGYPQYLPRGSRLRLERLLESCAWLPPR